MNTSLILRNPIARNPNSLKSATTNAPSYGLVSILTSQVDSISDSQDLDKNRSRTRAASIWRNGYDGNKSTLLRTWLRGDLYRTVGSGDCLIRSPREVMVSKFIISYGDERVVLACMMYWIARCCSSIQADVSSLEIVLLSLPDRSRDRRVRPVTESDVVCPESQHILLPVSTILSTS